MSCEDCAKAYSEGYEDALNAESARFRERADALAEALEELCDEVWPHEMDAHVGEPEEGTSVAGPVDGGTIARARAALRAYREETP